MTQAVERPEAVNLRAEQELTLASPKMPAGLAARGLFVLMDLVYGRRASLSKFRVLEIVARVPYIAWEQVAYIAITHTHSTPKFARNVHTEVQSIREQQDNELFHLLIIEELLANRGVRQGLIRYRALPQVIAWLYYHLSWLLYVVNPRWSHALNVSFEDHAEHEYMQYVADHPELDDEPWTSDFSDDYGEFATVGDLLRQIGIDEREHKEHSIEKMHEARFGRRRAEVKA